MGLLAVAPLFVYGSRKAASSGDFGKVGAAAVKEMELLRVASFGSLTAGGSLSSNVTSFSDATDPARHRAVDHRGQRNAGDGQDDQRGRDRKACGVRPRQADPVRDEEVEMKRHSESGFTVMELMVSLAVFSLTATGLASMLVDNAKLNKSQQMAITAQADARNCVSMIEQVLRTSGWDPKNTGLSGITLQSPAAGSDNWIEIRADLDEDTATTSAGEDVTIRKNGTTLEWKTSTSGSYSTLSPNITNDADGDGTPELMFTPDSTTNPTRITVRVTARSAAPDPRTGQYLRATVSTDIVLRGRL